MLLEFIAFIFLNYVVIQWSISSSVFYICTIYYIHKFRSFIHRHIFYVIIYIIYWKFNLYLYVVIVLCTYIINVVNFYFCLFSFFNCWFCKENIKYLKLWKKFGNYKIFDYYFNKYTLAQESIQTHIIHNFYTVLGNLFC